VVFEAPIGADEVERLRHAADLPETDSGLGFSD
jgi:hypothetical protein